MLLRHLQRNGGAARIRRQDWIFDTCHFHFAAPCCCSLQHQQQCCHTQGLLLFPHLFFFFLKVCSACYHEWAPGLRNPITSSVSEHCCHSHVYRSHVPQIRNDVPISCSSLLQFSLPPLTQCVSLIEAAVHLRGCCSAHSNSDSASSTAGASTG